MLKYKWLLVAALVAAGYAGLSFGQAGDGANPQPGAGNPAMGLLMRFNGLAPYVSALAEANLSPDFTLTVEQKTKIKEIRDQFQKDYQEFIKKNQDQIDKISQAVRDAQGDPEAMRDAVRQAMQDGQDLISKGPKAPEYVAKIKAVLTGDQAEQVDKKLKEMQQQRPGMGFGRGGAPGSGGN